MNMTMTSSKMLKPASKANENRKVPKPLIERKRRARINKSLTELQTLLGEVVAKVPNRKSGKVEKADVLEVTVAHLRQLKNRKQDATVGFQEGFQKCLEEVKLFFENNDNEIGSSVVGCLEGRLAESKPRSSVECSVIRYSTSPKSSPVAGMTLAPMSPDDGDCVWRPW